MRTVQEIKEEISKVEKAQQTAVKKQERCVNRLAALITYLFFSNGFVIYYSRWQLGGTIVSFIFFISLALFWTTQKIVRFCNRRAKRKAHDNKVKDLNKNSIK